jgi:hypothetical protein
MTRDEAVLIDKEKDLLPGGSGEHNFCVSDPASVTDVSLDNFAEMCGGFYFRGGVTGTLSTCDNGTYILTFANDLSRIVRVSQDTGFVYWDESKERVFEGAYQGSNSFEPPLDDDTTPSSEYVANKLDQVRVD